MQGISPSIPLNKERNPFHEALAIHTHQNCSYCHKVQRCEFKRLQRCARCATAVYCSKECQTKHWPEHKQMCKEVVVSDKELLSQTKIPHAYTDLFKWDEFYATPIKNCLVAALDLRDNPKKQSRSMLVIHLIHKGGVNLPIEHRFNIDSICCWERGGFLPADKYLDSGAYKQACAFGKVEMGSDYYGTGMYMLIGQYSPIVYRFLPKCFAIDKTVARARVAGGDWWLPLRDILENGKKMKFCCKKIEGVGCCCGGWVHDDKVKKGDAWR